MNIRIWLVSVMAAGFCCISSYGGPLAGVGVRDSALVGSIERWSVGLGAEWMNRDIKFSHNDQTEEIEARTFELFAGYDVADWLTVFATAGSTEFRSSDAVEYGDNNLKFSAGLQGNLWRTEIMDPEFMTGTLTLKSVIEFSTHQIDEEDEGIDGYWMEYYLAIPVCYEIFSDTPDNLQQVPYSLAISAGPVFSLIDGDIDGLSGSDSGFRGEKSVGVFGAVDIYFAHNFSIGCQVEYINSATIGGSMTYHF
ncbi:MAG: hypothetical protein A2283_16735 [Lentisphaerae bacterium RIFOXYA12_FULL_48_11]|nr:MAG: hypothetical protein A2283_16735 [Lentisphaerae bacterium RIFOXYA12_FULL_48_11]